jgi:predicted alpha/beta superfamily hydrolase
MKSSNIKIINHFHMPQLNRTRTLRIYLPPEYDETDRRYPVLYMQDAQNLFSIKDSAFGQIWNVAEILDKNHEISPEKDCIIVGIDNGELYRYSEYSPWKSEIVGYYLPQALSTGMPGGEGFQYIDFIVKTLKPYIDLNFKTLSDREHTGICGSSMGGLISLCAGITHQDIFSKIGAFSSAFYFAEDEVIKLIKKNGKNQSMSIYLDVGTQETSNHAISNFPEVYVNCSKNILHALQEVGFQDSELKFVIDKGGIHNETDWEKRFPIMFQWIFKKTD